MKSHASPNFIWLYNSVEHRTLGRNGLERVLPGAEINIFIYSSFSSLNKFFLSVFAH